MVRWLTGWLALSNSSCDDDNDYLHDDTDGSVRGKWKITIIRIEIGMIISRAPSPHPFGQALLKERTLNSTAQQQIGACPRTRFWILRDDIVLGKCNCNIIYDI